MQILPDAPFLLQHTFLIQFLINIDVNPHWRLLALPAHIPLSILHHRTNYHCGNTSFCITEPIIIKGNASFYITEPMITKET